MALSSFMQTSQTGNMQRLIASSLPVASAYFNRALHGSSVFHMGVGQHQNDPDVLHKEKLKHLSGKSTSSVKGTQGWSEILASDSEAAVKAERHAGDDSVEELQAHSIKKVRVLHDGEADDSGEEQPKNVPERAKR